MTESGLPIESDDDAVAELHRELAGQLRGLAWAILRDWSLAEDAVQEAFLLLAAKLGAIPFEQRRGWLVRTVQFVSLNLRRTRRRQERWVREEAEGYQDFNDPVSGATGEATGEAAAIQLEELQQVRDALVRLPAEQMTVVRMRLYEEKSFQQISNHLGVPLGTVLSRMRLAMERLRSTLK